MKVEICGHERLDGLRKHIETALREADELELRTVGVRLSEALNALDHAEGKPVRPIERSDIDRWLPDDGSETQSE
ncbi:hypothetical protein [Altererythrobacter sp.]|uniref:hypothetical protein n=1 Tax=Altererythrobacter sp. TaxID=1872480 RepID=UPI003D12780E